MCEKPFICICLLFIWHVLGPIKTFISAFVRARLCVCQNEDERMSERGGREGRPIHVLLILSIFVVAIILLFFFSSLYSIRILHSLQN